MSVGVTVVTRKGQITIPSEIRKLLGIKEGDKVLISLSTDSNKEAVLRPIRSITELTAGMLKPRKMPEDFKELREIFMDEMAEQGVKRALPTDTEI